MSSYTSAHQRPQLSVAEWRSQMSMWVALASPLVLGLDPRPSSPWHMGALWPQVLEILTNPEVLRVHKDPMAKMGFRVDTGLSSGGHAQAAAYPAREESCKRPTPCVEPAGPRGQGTGSLGRCSALLAQPTPGGCICAHNAFLLERPLSNGDTAVVLVNRGSKPNNITLVFANLGDGETQSFHVRDLWARENLGLHHCCFTAVALGMHDARFLRLTPAKGATPSRLCDTGWGGCLLSKEGSDAHYVPGDCC